MLDPIFVYQRQPITPKAAQLECTWELEEQTKITDKDPHVYINVVASVKGLLPLKKGSLPKLDNLLKA